MPKLDRLRCLNLTAIAAYRFWAVVHTFSSRLRIGLMGVGERVLILGGLVNDALARSCDF
jgi:hypothetical protein